MRRELSFAVEVREKDKEVLSLRTRVWTRILDIARRVNWDKQSIMIRVAYGNNFTNEGTYDDKYAFWLALDAFVEGYKGYGRTPEMRKASDLAHRGII